jgi:hypothetical protein
LGKSRQEDWGITLWRAGTVVEAPEKLAQTSICSRLPQAPEPLGVFGSVRV